MDDFEAATKEFLQLLTPLVETIFGGVGAAFQVILRAPEAVAIALAFPVVTLAVVLSVDHRKKVKRLNAARRERDNQDSSGAAR